MKINKIKLKNFRQYQDIELNFNENFNSLVMDNGAGKSTLRAAIVFAMYGTEYVYDNGYFKKDYLKQEDKSVFWTASKGRKNFQENVVVNLELETSKKHIIYIERSINYSRGKFIEEILYEEKCPTAGFKRETMSTEGFLKIFPKHFASFTFIDGERINEISTAIGNSKGNKSVKDEIKQITQIDKLEYQAEIIRQTLKQVTADMIKQDDISDDKKIQLEKERDILHSIAFFESQISTREEKRNMHNEDIKSIDEQLELVEFYFAKQSAKKELLNANAILNTEVENAKTNIIDESSSMLSRRLISKFYNENLEMVNKSEINVIPGLTQEAIDYMISTKKCLCKRDIGEEIQEILVELKKKQPPENLSNAIGLNMSDATRDTELFSESINEKYDKYANATKKINENIVKIKEIDNQLKEHNKQDEKTNRELFNRQKELSKKVSTLENEIKNAQSDLAKEKQKHEMVKDKISELEKKNQLTVLEIMKHRLETAYKEIKLEINDIDTAFLSTLNKEINKYANVLLKDSAKIDIDKNYIPKVIYGNNTNASSSGQDVIISLSYLFALMDTIKFISKTHHEITNVYNENYPIVLDAVFATFGENFIEKVMEQLNNYDGQIIFLNNDAHYKSCKNFFKDGVEKFTLVRDADSEIIRIRSDNE